MILGTLHHQGSMKGFRMYLKVKLINEQSSMTKKNKSHLGSDLGKGA